MNETGPKSGGRSLLERAAGAPLAPGAGGPAGGTLLERAIRTGGEPAADVGLLQPGQPVPAGRSPSYAERTQGGETMPQAGRGSHQPRRGTINLDRLREGGYVLPDAPATATAEEFRLVKRALLTNAAARGPNAPKNANLILIGSALPGEGKTFCALNLALSIASERDLTVLLVDADFAKPEIVGRLGLEPGPGLIDVVEDRSLDIGECLIRTQIPNFTVLPAGRRSNLTPELLASERMQDIVEDIAKRYTDRIVIFDSPPALASSAAAVLASHVGQVLFVVEAETTREAELREGLALMAACPNVQLLLNRSRFDTGVKRFGDYYAYGY